ncbi:MAG: outer membrane beta-barrel protein [Patescibacteria group bacterium]
MKNIWIVLVLVFSFVFVSQINAKDGGISKEEWNKSVTEEKIDELINSRRPAKEKEIPQLALPEQTTSYKDAEGVASKDEWERINKTTPPVKHYKDGSVAEKKFSARIGYGNAYGLGIKVESRKVKINMNNSPSFTARLGYSLNKYVELQGEYSRASNFGRRIEYAYSHYKTEYSNQYVFSAYTANIKLAIPVTIEDITFSPYIFGGLGRATFKSIFNRKRYAYGELTYNRTYEYSESGKYSKIGGGIDTKIYKNLFLFSEYSYQKINLRIDDQKIAFSYSQTTGGIGLKF